MGLEVGEAALDEDVGVESDDGVDAGGGVAGEDDAGEQKGNDVFAAEERVADFLAGGGGAGLGGDFHFMQLDGCLFRRAGAEERGAGLFTACGDRASGATR